MDSGDLQTLLSALKIVLRANFDVEHLDNLSGALHGLQYFLVKPNHELDKLQHIVFNEMLSSDSFKAELKIIGYVMKKASFRVGDYDEVCLLFFDLTLF